MRASLEALLVDHLEELSQRAHVDIALILVLRLAPSK